MNRAEKLFDLWLPKLEPLAKHYTEDCARLFPGLFAFMGLQCAFWLLWQDALRQAETDFIATEMDYHHLDSGLHSMPWYCLFQPVSDSAGWALVRGSGLPETESLYASLNDLHVRNVLADLSLDGRTMVYGAALSLLQDCGGLGDERLYITAEDAEYVRKDSWFRANHYMYRLTLPKIRAEQLSEDWPLWFASVQPMQAELFLQVKQITLHEEKKIDVQGMFQLYADQLWVLAQQRELIKCGPFIPTMLSRGSLKYYFTRRRVADYFSGLFLILGDHNALWETVLASVI